MSHNLNIKLKTKIFDKNKKLKRETIKISGLNADSHIMLNNKKVALDSPTLQFFNNLGNSINNNGGEVPKFRGVHGTPATDQVIGVQVGTGTNAVTTGDTALQTPITHSPTGLEFGSNSVIEQGTTTTNGASWTEKSTSGHARQNKSGFDVDTITDQGGNTWRYTFNGAPDLSSAIVGENVTFANATNVGNNGTFPTTAVNNGSNYIEITNASGVAEGTDSPCTASIRIDAWGTRYGHTSVVFNNKMWIMGGYNGSIRYNDVWSSEDGVTWVEETSSANWSARDHASLVVFGNKMWIMGGYNGGYLNDVWSSEDGVTWVEETASAGWSDRYRTALIVFDNKMWIMGGNNGATYYNDVWTSEDGVIWAEETASANWSDRRSLCSVVFNNKMWIMGGYNGSIRYNDVWSSSDGANWVEETSSANWSDRDDASLIVFNNKMWIMGGNNGATYYNDVWTSEDGVIWAEETASANWSARDDTPLVAFNNKIWIMGGFNGSTYYNDVWTAEEAITTGLQRNFTNKSVGDITINEFGLKTGQSSDASGSLVCVRDLATNVVKPNKTLTAKYKINAAINTTLTFTKNFWLSLAAGFGNANQNLTDTTSTNRNILPFSASNDMDCQGVLNDVDKGLVIGSGGGITWETDDITLIPDATCDYKVQTYTAPAAAGSRSSIEFNRQFENTSGGQVNVTQMALRGENNSNSFSLILGTLAETLQDGDIFDLTLEIWSDV